MISLVFNVIVKKNHQQYQKQLLNLINIFHLKKTAEDPDPDINIIILKTEKTNHICAQNGAIVIN